MWTAKNRGRYDRSKLRYPSDLTDDEWAHVAPLIAPHKPRLTTMTTNKVHIIALPSIMIEAESTTWLSIPLSPEPAGSKIIQAGLLNHVESARLKCSTIRGRVARDGCPMCHGSVSDDTLDRSANNPATFP
jgi:hypothetical protein